MQSTIKLRFFNRRMASGDITSLLELVGRGSVDEIRRALRVHIDSGLEGHNAVKLLQQAAGHGRHDAYELFIGSHSTFPAVEAQYGCVLLQSACKSNKNEDLVKSILARFAASNGERALQRILFVLRTTPSAATLLESGSFRQFLSDLAKSTQARMAGPNCELDDTRNRARSFSCSSGGGVGSTAVTANMTHATFDEDPQNVML